MPQRSITIYTGEQDHEWIKTALETLADDIITDEEAGQRGTKLTEVVEYLKPSEFKQRYS